MFARFGGAPADAGAGAAEGPRYARAAKRAAEGAVQPTIPPCAWIIARVAALNAGK